MRAINCVAVALSFSRHQVSKALYRALPQFASLLRSGDSLAERSSTHKAAAKNAYVNQLDELAARALSCFCYYCVRVPASFGHRLFEGDVCMFTRFTRLYPMVKINIPKAALS